MVVSSVKRRVECLGENFGKVFYILHILHDRHMHDRHAL